MLLVRMLIEAARGLVIMAGFIIRVSAFLIAVLAITLISLCAGLGGCQTWYPSHDGYGWYRSESGHSRSYYRAPSGK